MVEIIGVRFKSGGKQYYFDPAGLEVQPGQGVIVETSRGLEYGECAQGNTQVEEETVVQPLRPLVRIATEEDEKTVEKNREKEAKAFQICQEKIAAHGLEMKLVEAEYSFEGNKVLFFFTAEGRVDFRALVKDLASTIHARIELRQIGVRDEAKMLGGLGICGRPFCCAQFLDEFQPVSIKMAKHTPKQESFVETPDGAGTVSSVNLLRQQVQVRLDSAPDTPKCYHNCEICVVRNGKGKRPEGYVEPPLEELAKLRRAPEPEAAPEPTSSNPLAAALEAVFNGERPPEPEGERPRGEGEGRRRRRRGGRSEGASGGESRSQGEGQQRSRREWERRPEKPRDKEPGTAEAEGVQEGGERKPSRRRRRRPRGNRPAPGPEGNG